MMWQVLWNKCAEKELTEAWMAAMDRQAITEAANQIDQLLRTDPLSAGESRQENFRILIVLPLVVQYEVIEADRKVQVLQCVGQKNI